MPGGQLMLMLTEKFSVAVPCFGTRNSGMHVLASRNRQISQHVVEKVIEWINLEQPGEYL